MAAPKLNEFREGREDDDRLQGHRRWMGEVQAMGWPRYDVVWFGLLQKAFRSLALASILYFDTRYRSNDCQGFTMQSPTPQINTNDPNLWCNLLCVALLCSSRKVTVFYYCLRLLPRPTTDCPRCFSWELDLDYSLQHNGKISLCSCSIYTILLCPY